MTNDKIFLFIDSSIYISSGFNFESGSFAAVKKYCIGNVVQLLIDSIVTNEVTTHIKNDIGKAIADVNNKLKNSSLCGLKNANKIVLLDESMLVEFILKQWNAFLDTCKVNNLLYTDIQIADILDDYFNRTPPFKNSKDKKNEFPDAVMIKSLKHFMQSQNINTKLLVVSGDKIWKDCFEGDSRVQYSENISAALEIISLTAIGSVYCETEKLVSSAYDDLKAFIQKEIIDRQELFIDFNFDDIEEVYFRNVELNCQRIEFINENHALFSVEFDTNILIEYVIYGDNAYRDLHRTMIELSVSFEKDAIWNINNISLKNTPVVNKKTFVKSLPLYCSECEVRLFSENETNGDKCKECDMSQNKTGIIDSDDVNKSRKA